VAEALTVYQIPVCPFSQRLRILLELKGRPEAVRFEVVDISRPREPWLLELTRGTTALPVMRTPQGLLKESLVILRYLEESLPVPPVARADPFERAVENMLIAQEGDFTMDGYRLVMNQDPARREDLRARLISRFAALDDFLRWQSPEGTFLFERFGMAEVVFAPIFARFWFLDYYEGFELPPGLERVRRWHDACLAHPAAQQVSREEVVKAYYDYARGSGNGALPEGRRVSSFAFAPHWSERPWPPRDKYGPGASDAALGLA
jgi:glutathione S-transferase